MLIYVGEPHYKLIATQEGTGDNLSSEDIKDGYVDYWLSSIYEQDGEDIKLVDSGQILTSKLIADMEEGEVLRRLFEYWEVNDPRDTGFTTYTNYVILEH